MSPWHGLPEAERRSLERYDKFANLRNALRTIAKDKSEWAGIPMPLDGETLIVEPSYPFAAVFKPKELPEGVKVRNRFWSDRLKSDIIVYEHEGKVRCDVIPGVHSLPPAIAPLGGCEAWGVEQESTALNLLSTLVNHHHFKQYLLTGMFLESSQHSNVTYLFRKLRPTVALVFRGEQTIILAGLCMHPIAYYAGSWAGAMCPTDDVIAHLMLMRGDEPMFWRRSNQHPPWHPGAGL